MEYEILRLREHPEWKQVAAQWFHAKWGIPLQAYLDSMDQCVSGGAAVSQWYMAVSGGQIIGGLGVIENDFHNRKDLTPNVCAVYVEEPFRCRRIAGALLRHVCEDMHSQGIDVLYLLTNHTSFYERHGWEFHCMAQGGRGGRTGENVRPQNAVNFKRKGRGVSPAPSNFICVPLCSPQHPAR